MKRSSIGALSTAILVYLALMYIPFQRYAFWGMDTGEYIALTKSIVSSGFISPEYHGWTQGYPYFQGHFVLASSFSMLSGESVNLSVWAPVFMSFVAVPIVFLTAMRFSGPRAAVLSAFFIAAIMPFAYQNSHPAPHTLGHLLFLATLLSLWAVERKASDHALILPLLLSLAMIITHPMSGYIMALTLGMIYLFRALRGAERSRLMYFTAAYSGMLLLYWGTVAYPFIGPATGIPQYALILLTLAVYPSVLAIDILISGKARERPAHIPDSRTQARYIAVVSGVGLAILAYMVFFTVPGTGEPLNPVAIVFYVPLIFLSILSISGISLVGISERGRDLVPWLAAIGISALIGWITGSDMLIPFRHMEYMVMPMALMFGAGVAIMILRTERPLSSAVSATVAVLLLGSALTVYPPPEAMQGFSEATEWSEVPAISAAAHMQGNISTDHRLSSVLMSMGQENVSWDDARDFFQNPQGSAYPSGYVLITDEMSESAVFSWKDSTISIDEGQFHRYYMVYSGGSGRIYLFTPAS